MSRILVLTLVLLVAGCVAPGSEVDPADAATAEAPADWAARAVPFGSGHDHYDRASHENLSTPNFRLLGHDPLLTDTYGKGAGSYLCADAAGNASQRLAVVHSIGPTSVLFVVADITDPTVPKKVGELTLRGTTARDVAVTEDTRWLAVATDTVNDGSLLEGVPSALRMSASWRGGCGGVERDIPLPAGVPAASGMLLVSLEDPTSPRIADYFPLPVLGAHSIGVDRVDGVDIVTASVTNLAQHASYFMFFTIEEGKLAFQSVYQNRPVAANVPAANLHNDGWVRKHPVTQQSIAYLADWDAGLALVDLTDITMPKDIGRWSDYDAAKGLDNSAAVHSALPLATTWEGRHYTLIGQEILGHPDATPTGVISILDTTDPAKPVRVGAWTLPVDVEWDAALVFSTHYIALSERTMFVTMYHGGVWAVDLADVTSPRSVGAFVPAIAPPEEPVSKSYSWTPTVMEAKVIDTGDLVVWDSTSGLYLVRFDPGNPAPPVEEWAFAWTP